MIPRVDRARARLQGFDRKDQSALEKRATFSVSGEAGSADLPHPFRGPLANAHAL